MTWIVVVVLALGALAGVVAACVLSTPRRPASNAAYTTNALLAAGAVSAAAVCAILAAVFGAYA